MDAATFDAHRAEIAAMVRLVRADASRRGRYRMLAVYDTATAEIVLEVFGTPHGPVVVHKLHGTRVNGKTAPVAVVPLTGVPGTVYRVAGRNAPHRIDAAALVALIAQGATRHAV